MRVPRWFARLRSDSAPAEMSFLEHLEELRGVILSCLWVFLLLSIAAWSVSGRLLDFLVRHTVGTAQFIRPLEAFTCRVKLAFLLGFAVGLPFFALRVWGFVVPGLLRHERRLVTPLVVWSTVLFLIGVGFSSLALTPQMLRVLMSFQTEVIRANLAVGFLLDFFVKMAFACGLMFQLPLVVAILSYVGVVTPSFLKSKWRHSVVISLIVAAVVTPGDGPSQLVLAAPVIVLYFISIAVSAAIHRSRRRARAAAGE
jgi:sec-independent protein translocase protein TatC